MGRYGPRFEIAANLHSSSRLKYIWANRDQNCPEISSNSIRPKVIQPKFTEPGSIGSDKWTKLDDLLKMNTIFWSEHLSKCLSAFAQTNISKFTDKFQLLAQRQVDLARYKIYIGVLVFGHFYYTTHKCIGRHEMSLLILTNDIIFCNLVHTCIKTHRKCFA